MTNHNRRFFSFVMAAALFVAFALQAQAREKPLADGASKMERMRSFMPPPESLNFIHELAERTGRIGVADELNSQTIQFIGFVRVGRGHEPDGPGLVLEEGQAMAVFRVPLELKEEETGRRPGLQSGKERRRGPRIRPLLTGEEAQEGGFNLLALHNAEIGATSFFVVRPMAEEETSKHAQKSESADAALTEQDQQDLQAIQDMQDQDAMDNIWIRPASPEATTRMVEVMTAGVVEVIVDAAAANNLPLHSPR